MAAKDPETRAHLDWLGMLQPVGLVVSPPALVRAQAIVPRNVVELQKRFVATLERHETRPPRLTDFPRFACEFLDWEPDDLVGGDALPKSLEIALPEYQQVLAPTWAVPDPDAEPGNDGERRWLMLIVEVDGDFDDAGPRDARGWRASPQIRLERLLRDTNVTIGMLVGPDTLRLVYAPSGESSGHLSFPIKAMSEVPGRPILAACHMLLCAERLFTLPSDRRLPALLAESRKYQNEVSTKLSEQVLRALGELLRGFVAADDAVKGELLGTTSREDPQHIYGGLITTMMRLVFLLYAEERELMPQDPIYAEHYGVTGLFEKLRADAGLYPDTMDQRYGAWARLLSLFRLVFHGGAHGSLHLPARHGQLFNPEEFPFLEGRPYGMTRGMDERIVPPRVSDGVVYRVLEDLLLLEGERLSYRSLDVEQIGSVYEAIMGFEVERAFGPSLGVRPQHVVVNLQKLLEAKAGQRAKILEDEAGSKLSKGAAQALADAASIEEIVAALGQRTSPQTPTVLAPGALYLQPTEERRRSGSHYTPRSLTEPIVRTTLRPVLEGLGERPTAAQILELKVCDPAMGSGAFLVEACRQLAAKVEEAWAAHGETPTKIPADETVELYARRKVAQQCLYGVDKNSFAVNLAKMSLWLVTFARDHAFTFIDHSLKCGDSLVGLTRRQIAAFHWQEPDEKELPLFEWVAGQVGQAKTARGGIFALGDEGEAEKRVRWQQAEDALDEARLVGDLIVSAFFADEKGKDREKRRLLVWEKVREWQRSGKRRGELEQLADAIRRGTRPISPFHWQIEFPEVFSDSGPAGFDIIVGNPPFGGKNTIVNGTVAGYLEWLKNVHPGTQGNTDLVAHFFRKSFDSLSKRGALGLLATNTIAQGDTRTAGLAWICNNGGTIYEARRRYRWPGPVAVVVSIVHIQKTLEQPRTVLLDGKSVPQITSFLFHAGGNSEPYRLDSNAGLCYQGTNVLGAGFTFGGKVGDGSNPMELMSELLKRDPRNGDVIFPYIGGRQVNSHPQQEHDQYVINFGCMTEGEARRWPDLIRIVERKVKPERDKNKRLSRRDHWWRFGETTPALFDALRGVERVIVCSQVCSHLSFVFLPSRMVFSHKLSVFPLSSFTSFCLLQSRVHEVWARFFSGTAMDLLRYTPTDCFETFPFSVDLRMETPSLMDCGRRYYRYRADLMAKNQEGLTDTYNRFHDPSEISADVLRLRNLHEQMDRAALDSYGWADINPNCEFLLDYEDEDDDSSSKRKKPWRYRWPDNVQEEVLTRLLDLNQERAEEERLAGKTKSKKFSKKPRIEKPVGAHKKALAGARKKKDAAAQPKLFGDGDKS